MNANTNPAAESAPIAHVVRTATPAHARIRTFGVLGRECGVCTHRFAVESVHPNALTERNDRMATAKTMTPKQLASEIGIDAKVLRAYLRKNHTRPDTAKNTSWIVPANVCAAARKAFAKNVATNAPAKKRVKKSTPSPAVAPTE